MNTISIIKNLIEQNNAVEFDQHLSSIWNQVWNDNGKINYANLRLFKTVDKIKNISQMGIDFRDKHIIDIGCGNGTTLLYLRKYFNIKGLGVDISEKVIDELQLRIKDKNLSFDTGDHRNLENIDSNQFDIALSFGVIEHFCEFSLALAEARRVLKKDGQLVLIQPHLLSFGVVQEYFLRFLGKWRFGNQKDFSCFHYRSLLQQMGFVNIEFLTAPPYPDMKITRFFDRVCKLIIPFWGHYLYIIARK